MALTPVHPAPPRSVQALLAQRDWAGVEQLLKQGFPPNAAWLDHGSLFELFAVAASMPIPGRGTSEQSAQGRVVQQFLVSGLENRMPFGQRSSFSLPLTISALLGRCDFLTLLMASGHHPNAQALGIHSPLAVMCLASGDHATLSLPGRSDRLAVLETLVNGGADLEQCVEGQCRPLQLATMARDLELVCGLLRQGAQVDGRSSVLGFSSGPHWSPLAWAIYQDEAGCAHALLESGADFALPMAPGLSILECAGAHAGPDTWTALVSKAGLDHPDIKRAWFHAVSKNKLASLLWFLSVGFDTQAAGEDGWTALEVAGASQAVESFVWLARSGMDPLRPGIQGKTALERLKPQQRAAVQRELSIGTGPRLAWSNPERP